MAGLTEPEVPLGTSPSITFDGDDKRSALDLPGEFFGGYLEKAGAMNRGIVTYYINIMPHADVLRLVEVLTIFLSAFKTRWITIEGDGYLHYYRPLSECGKILLNDITEIAEINQVATSFTVERAKLWK
tara:strand:- start:770 stop:1156 length:387 start_codon:yes stop_codon:yes gene_type:complete